MSADSEKAVAVLKTILDHMGISHEISVMEASEPSSPATVVLQAAEHGKTLIGKNGQNLNALEHVVRSILLRQGAHPRAIIIDVNDYRKVRTNQTLEMAQQVASRVRETRKAETLPPMEAYERRIVHTELASWSDLATESTGQDPQRRVIIRPL